MKIEEDKNKKKKNVFVLANGTTTSKPYSHRADTNVQLCLKMRFDPEWSIMAAADYGRYNLDILIAKGFRIGALTENEKGKVMYLMHHEGEGNGPLFIRDRLLDMKRGNFSTSEARLRDLFAKQVGSADATRRIDAERGAVDVAYREWLAHYIDTKIDVRSYYAITPPARTEDLLNIVSRL